MCGILWYDPFPNILLDSGWTHSIWKFNTLGKFSCIIPLIISSYKFFLYSLSGISVNLEFKSFCSVRFSYIIFVCFKVISSSFSCIFSLEFRLIGLGSQMSWRFFSPISYLFVFLFYWLAYFYNFIFSLSIRLSFAIYGTQTNAPTPKISTA